MQNGADIFEVECIIYEKGEMERELRWLSIYLEVFYRVIKYIIRPPIF